MKSRTLVFALAMSACLGAAAAAEQMPLDQLQAQVRALGRNVVPGPTAALYAPRIIDAEPYAGVAVQRDIAYGPAARHLLDIFGPAAAGERARPVLVFVHGGAFVAGNRRISPTSPFYDNVMLWSVRQGMIGVNMTYRLSPVDPWPAGPEDIGAAIRWVHDHIAAYGGDPDRVFLLGHSAGATHVAAYVSHPALHRVDRGGIAGALMLSGVYRITTELVAGSPTYPGYFGSDPAKYDEQSSIAGLIAARMPLWIGNAELDPPSFEDQARTIRALLCANRKCPSGERFAGHSHMSEAYSINSDDPRVGDSMSEFIRSH